MMKTREEEKEAEKKKKLEGRKVGKRIERENK